MKHCDWVLENVAKNISENKSTSQVDLQPMVTSIILAPPLRGSHVQNNNLFFFQIQTYQQTLFCACFISYVVTRSEAGPTKGFGPNPIVSRTGDIGFLVSQQNLNFWKGVKKNHLCKVTHFLPLQIATSIIRDFVLNSSFQSLIFLKSVFCVTLHKPFPWTIEANCMGVRLNTLNKWPL